MNRPGTSRRRSAPVRTGVALIELALVMVMLVVIVFGCVDLGRFATTLIAVNNAAREGASFGSTHPVTDTTRALWVTKIRESIIDELSGVVTYDEKDLTIDEPVLIHDGVLLRVQVSVTQDFHTIAPWPLLPNPIPLASTAEMPVVR